MTVENSILVKAREKLDKELFKFTTLYNVEKSAAHARLLEIRRLDKKLLTTRQKLDNSRKETARWKYVAQVNRKEIQRVTAINVRLLTALYELIDEYSIPPVSPTSEAVRKALYSVYRLHNPKAKLK